MLLRILFTYKPTCLVKLERRRKKEEYEKTCQRRVEEKITSEIHPHSKIGQNKSTNMDQQKKKGGAITKETADEAGETIEELRVVSGGMRDSRQRDKPKPNNEIVIKVTKLD